MHSADARRITTHFWREKILQYFWSHLAAGGGGAGDVNIYILILGESLFNTYKKKNVLCYKFINLNNIKTVKVADPN